MATLSEIIKSKFSDKSKLPSWYQKRLEICNACPLMSENFTPKTIKEKLRFAEGYSINLGKPFCTICLCEIDARASLPGEDCSDTPPKWRPIEYRTVEQKEVLDYELKNLSEDKVKLEVDNFESVIQYGTIKQGTDTKVSVLVIPQTVEDFINLRVAASCGCTTPKIIKQGRDIKLDIEYDSMRIGNFDKLITLDYSANKKGTIRIRIKGNVVR